MKAGKVLLQDAFDLGDWKAFRHVTCIKPSELSIGPNSIDVTLHPIILIPDAVEWLDLKKPETCHYGAYCMKEDGWVIFPHCFLLGAANERFECDAPLTIYGHNKFFVQEMHGISTLGRCGLCIHATAGYGDYGFRGAFTLEIFNVSNRPIKIYPDIKIAQVEFNAVEGPSAYIGSYSAVDHYDGPVAPDIKGKF